MAVYGHAMPDKRPGAGALASKIAARLRARGIREVARTWAGMLRQLISSDEKLILLFRDLTSKMGDGRPVPEGVMFKEADATDAELYARDIGTDSPSTFQARLSESTHCFLVIGNGRVLHASWVTTSAAWMRELQRYFCPPAGEAYIYESFTRPDTRGRGIYPFALDSICEHLANMSIARAWVGVEDGNDASMRAVGKAGFEIGFDIRYRRRWGRLALSPPEGPAARPDHHFLSTTPNSGPG